MNELRIHLGKDSYPADYPACAALFVPGSDLIALPEEASEVSEQLAQLLSVVRHRFVLPSKLCT